MDGSCRCSEMRKGKDVNDDLTTAIRARITKLRKCMGRERITDEDLRRTIEVLEECVKEAPAPVPAGWRLVPEEPTPEMLDALRTYFDKRTRVEKCYSAMLYIAPNFAAATKGETE